MSCPSEKANCHGMSFRNNGLRNYKRRHETMPKPLALRRGPTNPRGLGWLDGSLNGSGSTIRRHQPIAGSGNGTRDTKREPRGFSNSARQRPETAHAANRRGKRTDTTLPELCPSLEAKGSQEMSQLTSRHFPLHCFRHSCRGTLKT